MIEILLSTMKQNDFSIIEKMNIHSKCLIINQSNNSVECIEQFGRNKMYTFNEKGVGLSRNIALLHSTESILLFADDDMIYYDDYESIIKEAYQKLPNADVIIFDIKLINSTKNGNFRNIKTCKKLNRFNAMRYGACRISVKKESIIRNRICFSTLFGGGSQYSAGEDSLFLIDCFNKKLNIYQYPKIIAEVDDSKSTWYTGINEKLIKDRGILYYVAFPRLYTLIYIYYAWILSKKTEQFNFFSIFKLFLEGKKEYK